MPRRRRSATTSVPSVPISQSNRETASVLSRDSKRSFNAPMRWVTVRFKRRTWSICEGTL